MVLNWKIWQHYEKNEKLAELYNSLWEKADTYAGGHGKIYDIKAPDFIEQALNAICENFVSWASFGVFGETEEEYYTELEKSKKTLTKWIKKVRKELKSYCDTFTEIEK